MVLGAVVFLVVDVFFGAVTFVDVDVLVVAFGFVVVAFAFVVGGFVVFALGVVTATDGAASAGFDGGVWITADVRAGAVITGAELETGAGELV